MLVVLVLFVASVTFGALFSRGEYGAITVNGTHSCGVTHNTLPQVISLGVDVVSIITVFFYVRGSIWLLTGLGLLGLVSYLIASVVLAFGPCDTSSAFNTFPWFMAEGGGFGLVLGAVAGLIISLLRYVAKSMRHE